MPKKKPRTGISKVQSSATLYQDILESGRVLSIDPSSGSSSSMPGYALLVGSTLVEAGSFEIHMTTIAGRLWSFAEGLRQGFEDIDLLIIEEIPPFMQSAGSSFRSRGVVNLHMSVGAALAVFGDKPVIFVPPSAWHADMRKLPFEYVKDDENDACMLAHCVYTKAGLDAVGLVDWIEERSNALRNTQVLSGKASSNTGRGTAASRKKVE